ncbi:hypothetical protein Taro_014691, partial [Colocasia esculenta]|nr:hypothetical protein [Colocasia esculenta]
STLVHVVSTQCIKNKAKRSSSVDTRSSSVDTRDRSQKTIWKTWDSVLTLDEVVSTLDQLPRTFWVKLGQCVDTRWGCVDTRCFPRTPSGLFWDSRSTRAQTVDTGTDCVDTSGFPSTKHRVMGNPMTLLMQRFTYDSYNSLTSDI